MDEQFNEKVAEARRMKAWTPFRDWHVVKPSNAPSECFDTKRKAVAYAKKHAPAELYKV
jgi:hypothetical protein